jgi:hypothetical protein
MRLPQQQSSTARRFLSHGGRGYGEAMAPPTVTIDLGEVPRAEGPAADVPWAAWLRLHRLLNRRPWRLIAAGAIGAAMLVAVPAAAPLPPPIVELQFALPADSVTFDQQYVYAAERGDGDPAGTTVTAYRFADGSLAWQATHPDAGDGAWIDRYGDLLLLLSVSVNSENDPPDEHVTLLNQETGEAIWTTAGHPVTPLSGRLLVRRTTISPGEPDTEPPLRHEYVAVDLVTGEPAWRVGTSGLTAGVDRAGSGRLLTLDADGQLSSYDLGTGARARSVAAIAAPADPTTQPQLQLHPPSSLILVQQAVGSDAVIRAYDTATLQRRWTRSYEFDNATDAIWLRVQPCGSLICVDPYRDGPPEALDPVTGDRHWSMAWFTGGGAPGGIVFTAPEHPWLGRYLLVSDHSAAGGPASWLVEAATGEPVLDLTDWRLGPGLAGLTGLTGHALPGSPGLRDETGAPVLVLSQQPDPSADGETWVGLLHPDPVRVRALAAIEGRHGWCNAQGRHVVCRAESQAPGPVSVTVWRVRW